MTRALRSRCCAVEIVEHPFKAYGYEHDDGHIEVIPALMCRKCGQEIGGDPDMLNNGDDY